MKVVRAQILGFCMGVRRAVEMAVSECGKAVESGRQVYSLGPLIHNPGVLKMLKEKGIICLGKEEALPGKEKSTVIIRAHGVSPFTEMELNRQGLCVLDATCPHVKKSQRLAGSFAEKGYHVFLAGEENHAEIDGIKGFVEDAAKKSGSAASAGAAASAGSAAIQHCWIAGNPAEAAAAAERLFYREPGASTALIGQTTMRTEEYSAIGEEIRRFFPSLEIVDSICGSTKDRQQALGELCGITDAIVIAGGRESANTRRLYSLAVELRKPAWLVEAVSDLPPEIAAFKTVGLSAGASTPDELINEIEAALNLNTSE